MIKGRVVLLKKILTNNELILHMKNKGIKFDLCDEKEALDFLNNNNYYFKLSSYRKNFEKYQGGDNDGKYIHLDFAYLRELSTIDMHLRKIIMSMCLDLEHAMKVRLINEIEINNQEDGYNLVAKFCEKEEYLNKIKRHKLSKYTGNIQTKYHPDYPIWAFLEIISFNDLVLLYKRYSSLYPERKLFSDLMFNVVKLRNACAHSNCLINDLKADDDSLSPVLRFKIAEIEIVSKSARKKYLKNHFIVDFITLLYVFDYFVQSQSIKDYLKKDLMDLFHTRILRHKDYFIDNQVLVGTYEFLIKIIDNYNKKV